MCCMPWFAVLALTMLRTQQLFTYVLGYNTIFTRIAWALNKLSSMVVDLSFNIDISVCSFDVRQKIKRKWEVL